MRWNHEPEIDIHIYVYTYINFKLWIIDYAYTLLLSFRSHVTMNRCGL